MPVCRRRATDAELDHTVPFPHGPTAESNLYAGCTHHHHLKHGAGWRVTQHADGRITWTTPTGHAYTSEPWDHRPEPDVHPARAGAGRRPRAAPSNVDPWGAPADLDQDDPAPF